MLSENNLVKRFLLFFFLAIITYGFSYAQDTLAIRIKSASGIQKAKLLNRMAYHLKAYKPDTAQVLARQAEKIGVEFSNDTIKADAYATLAESYIYLADYVNSTTYYFKAIEIAERINHRKKMASLYNGLGMLFYQMGDFEKSIDFLGKAAEIKLQDKDYLYYATINANISAVMQRLGRFREAIAILRVSERKIKEFNNIEILGNIYNSMGSVYQMAFKDLDSAEYFYRKNIEMLTDPKMDIYKMPAHRNLGELYIEKGKFEEAEAHLREALRICTNLSRPTEKTLIYASLSDLFEQKKDYKTALEFKIKQFKLNDSIFNREKEQVVHDLETKYEVEKKNLKIRSQEFIIEQEKSNKVIILLIAVLVIIVLLTAIFYFWFNKRLDRQMKEIKEKFFINVMHEIRTPLSMIRAPIHVLKSKITDSESLNDLDLADRSSQRLNELIDQMLDISKFNNLSYTLNETVGNLDSFVAEMILDYRNIASRNNLTFITEINHDNSLLYFDQDALNKIIGNLLSNAIKYTRPGGTIGFKMKEKKSGLNCKITFEVWDTGIGIPKKEHEKLFTRFYRGSKSSSNTKGIGIGLSLVKDLVDAYKGKIWFLSEEGIGSRFFVELDLKLQGSIPEKVTSESAENDKGLVLLVEDNKDVIDFVGNLLIAKNYRVVKALNGRIALEALKDITPDLILTDLMMDEMDGLAFLNEIKSNSGTSHIPVIVLSAKTSEQSKVEIMKAGAQVYLTKPFLPDELLSVIENQLNLILTLKKEIKNKIGSDSPGVNLEQKFSSTDPYAQKFFDLVFKHFADPELTVEFLADLMATNRSHFQRKIKNLTGYSPSDIIRFVRLDKSKEFLKAKKGNITEIAFLTGFSTQSYFSTCFMERFGMTPSEFLK